MIKLRVLYTNFVMDVGVLCTLMRSLKILISQRLYLRLYKVLGLQIDVYIRKER